jgi:pimeloyl-ACP methyl ester carboxylesterase
LLPEAIKISVPVLAVDHDFKPNEETVEIHQNRPHGQLMILPATGHGALMECPERANLGIREFLEQPDVADASR